MSSSRVAMHCALASLRASTSFSPTTPAKHPFLNSTSLPHPPAANSLPILPSPCTSTTPTTICLAWRCFHFCANNAPMLHADHAFAHTHNHRGQISIFHPKYPNRNLKKKGPSEVAINYYYCYLFLISMAALKLPCPSWRQCPKMRYSALFIVALSLLFVLFIVFNDYNQIGMVV